MQAKFTCESDFLVEPFELWPMVNGDAKSISDFTTRRRQLFALFFVCSTLTTATDMSTS